VSRTPTPDTQADTQVRRDARELSVSWYEVRGPPEGDANRTGGAMLRVVHTPGRRVWQDRVGVGGPDLKRPVGVGHGADPWATGQLGRPGRRDPGEQPVDDGKDGKRPAPAAATAAAPPPWTRTSTTGREGGEMDRASSEVDSGETSSTSEATSRNTPVAGAGRLLPAVRTRTGCT
jgi:hypothetical protein